MVILESLLHSFKAEGVDYFNFGTASFDLVYRLEKYESALLIDGIDAGLKPGELRIFALDKVSYRVKDSLISSHQLDLKSLFELCQKLKIKTKIFVAGIQIKDVSFGETLTDDLKNSAAGIIKEINSFMGTFLFISFFSLSLFH